MESDSDSSNQTQKTVELKLSDCYNFAMMLVKKPAKTLLMSFVSC